MNKKGHLPIFGVGPFYMGVIITITVLFAALSHYEFLLKKYFLKLYGYPL